MYYRRFDTTLCDMVIVGDEAGIRRLHLINEEGNSVLHIEKQWMENKDYFEDAIFQLRAYTEGKLKGFELKLNPLGTLFQKKVWQALSEIPYGEVRSYKEIAIAIGNHKAARAVGAANGKNPIPIIIPCHRVIGGSGQLTGYAFGLTLKEKLLQLERTS